MSFEAINPENWLPPKGYNNGMLYEGTKTLCVAGQIAWNAQCEMQSKGDLGGQFIQALRNVVSVVEAAGGRADMIAKLTIYVTDRDAYNNSLKAIGAGYREVMGKHFPAMALVIVAGLLEEDALVEIEALAILP